MPSLQRLFLGVALFLLHAAVSARASRDGQQCSRFNYEVERRIQDQLSGFLSAPQEIASFFKQLRSAGGFPSGSLEPQDREQFLKILLSFPSNLMYFYGEDGFGVGYDNSYNFVFYRESGNSGYAIDDPEFEKHFISCIEASTGTPAECHLEAGQPYIKFHECDDGDADCDLYEPCPDSDSQTLDCDDSAMLENDGITKDQCLERKKWCRKYTIEEAQPLPGNSNNRTGLGFVPESYFCYNKHFEVTQTPGDAFANDGSGELGATCVYEDGVTPVQRFLEGEYAFCGGNGAICNDTFVGAFYSPEFDARYRPWYLDAKKYQQPHWTEPYLYETGYVGMTFVQPMYSPTERGEIFEGVFAIDYKLEDFVSFLEDNYKDSHMLVAIYEDAEPNYAIGLSTGTQAAIQVLAADPSKPCPTSVQYGSKDCVTDRLPMDRIGNSRDDIALREAFLQQVQAGYPDDLQIIKLSDEIGADIFVCQNSLFESGGNLKWRILTLSPASEVTSDVILPEDPFFGPMIMIGLVGLSVCVFFWWYLYTNRSLRAVAFADWRFTACFVVGCGMLNAGSFTLLGENTEVTCLLRMWFFHFFFILALSALFVKAWRLYRLIGGSFRRTTISNKQAAMSTLPFIAVQTTILLIFTFVDPPKPTEIIENTDVFTRRIVCESNTDGFMITQLVFEAGMVAVGCVLAYLQRNLDGSFGESKPMLIAMYNIALVGIIVLIVTNVADMDGSGKKLLQAIGVLWGSVVSAAAFVVPRMVQIKKSRALRLSQSVRISGDFSSKIQPRGSSVITNGSDTHVTFARPTQTSHESSQMRSDVISESVPAEESALDLSESMDMSGTKQSKE